MSITTKKHFSLSPKRCIKEHCDQRNCDSNRETHLFERISTNEVHTANDWEHADFGDEQRKQKFLRLMGVKKNKNNDQKLSSDNEISYEKKHCRSKIENEEIDRELEKQFNGCLQSKILHKHHEGLGFHGGEVDTNNNTNQRTEIKFVSAATECQSSSFKN